MCVRCQLTLISKPTPPGLTTAVGSSMLKPATLPIAKPYPECVSGSPIDAPTIPGSDATLAICFTAGKKPPTPPASVAACRLLAHHRLQCSVDVEVGWDAHVGNEAVEDLVLGGGETADVLHLFVE